jgi:hypothetical protein
LGKNSGSGLLVPDARFAWQISTRPKAWRPWRTSRCGSTSRMTGYSMFVSSVTIRLRALKRLPDFWGAAYQNGKNIP